MAAAVQRQPAAKMAERARTGAPPSPDRLLFDSIGRFLYDHRLSPTPDNYRLAHAIVTRSNLAAEVAVGEATDGGIRLSQRDADRILREAGIVTGVATNHAVLKAREQLDLVSRIIDRTQSDAESYGRDLETSAALIDALPAGEAMQELLRVTEQMIARTRAVEGQLQSTTEEVQTLRRELAEASEEARRDPLTGLVNRRALEDSCRDMLGSGVQISAAVCDIDKFKRINDQFGHPVGDRVLKAVSRALEASCGQHLVSRFGGEEFVVLFARMSADAAGELIDAARIDLSERHFRVKDSGETIGQVTFSAGVAEAKPSESWNDLLNRADALLYEAKARGRNRIVVEGQPS